MSYFITNKKGNDDVIACFGEDPSGITSNQNIGHYFNTGGYRIPSDLDPNNPIVGLSAMSVKWEKGILTCSMKRQNSMLGVVNYFDLSKNYYILTAYGDFNRWSVVPVLGYHRLRTASSQIQSFF